MEMAYRQQQASTCSRPGASGQDRFIARTVVPPEHTTAWPQVRQDDANQRNAASTSAAIKPRSHNEPTGMLPNSRMKRSGSFKSFLPGKDLSKSPLKSPKKETKILEREPLKKSKSSTALSALFSRPRSSKGTKQEEPQRIEDKENQEPARIAETQLPTPIWAQFATTGAQDLSCTTKVPLNDGRIRGSGIDLKQLETDSCSKNSSFDQGSTSPSRRAGSRTRPLSECLRSDLPSATPSDTGNGPRRSGRIRENATPASGGSTDDGDHGSLAPGSQAEHNAKRHGNRVMAAVAHVNQKTKDLPKVPMERPVSAPLDPKAIDSAFEALLDIRNVPPATRNKMRSLDTNIKADFVKQDKIGSGSTSSIEDLAMPYSRPHTGKRSKTNDIPAKQAIDLSKAESPKKSRPRSLTFTFSKGDQSPSKKHKSGSHQRTRSGEGITNALANPPDATRHRRELSFFSKADKFALPEQVIAYLRKVQQPESVEVGKIQKLRQLLRNEAVGWVDEFIADGGMTETVDLLYRIIAVEWRCVEIF